MSVISGSITGGRRQEAVRGAEHDREVGVEPDGAGQRTDRHTVTDPAEAPGRHLEFRFERGSELAAGDRLARAVEVAQPVEHLARVIGGQPLGLVELVEDRATEPAEHLAFAPVGPIAPTPRSAGMTEIAAQTVDELGQLLGDLGVAFARLVALAKPTSERLEARPPVLVSAHTGGAGHPFPARHRDPVAIGATYRQIGQEIEDVGTAQAAAIEPEQIEQEPWHEALGDQRAGTTVPGDAGDVEVMFDEARVRSVGRPHEGHARERCTRPGGVDQASDGVADFVVGIGGRHDGDTRDRWRCLGWGSDIRAE